jgi:hypothetical protein
MIFCSATGQCDLSQINLFLHTNSEVQEMPTHLHLDLVYRLTQKINISIEVGCIVLFKVITASSTTKVALFLVVASFNKP